MARPSLAEIIHRVSTQFRTTYHEGIPLLHDDKRAFLSFTCCLMAIESLGAFMKPKGKNRDRFNTCAQMYLPGRSAAKLIHFGNLEMRWCMRSRRDHTSSLISIETYT